MNKCRLTAMVDCQVVQTFVVTAFLKLLQMDVDTSVFKFAAEIINFVLVNVIFHTVYDRFWNAG